MFYENDLNLTTITLMIRIEKIVMLYVKARSKEKLFYVNELLLTDWIITIMFFDKLLSHTTILI